MNIHPRLRWPSYVERRQRQVPSRFGDHSLREALDFVANEIKRLGAESGPTFTGNLHLTAQNKIGYKLKPEAGADPGASVWFSIGGEKKVIAIDRYTRLECNIYAIGRTISAMRQIQRDGGASILDQALMAFSALEHHRPESWDILGVEPGSSKEAIDSAFRAKANVLHPDQGGDPDQFRQLVEARDLCLAQV